MARAVALDARGQLVLRHHGRPYGSAPVLDLVIFDCDVVKEFAEDQPGNASWRITGDGRQELAVWKTANGAELPPTFTVESNNGNHEPGAHTYYWQSESWPIIRDLRLDDNLEVKSSWCRFWSTFRVIRDLPIAVLPEATARTILPAESLTRSGRNGNGTHVDWDGLRALGRNDYYIRIKGLFLASGLGTEDEVDEAIRRFNSALRNPMDLKRLNGTVTSGRKGW